MELFLVPHSKDLSADWIERYPETAPIAIPRVQTMGVCQAD
jgi:hypothetical protein